METFNLGFVFDNGKIVCIVVCSSNEPIDRNKVSNIASSYFNIGLNTKSNMRDVLNTVIDGIRHDCSIDAVLVNADVACAIPAK